MKLVSKEWNKNEIKKKHKIEIYKNQIHVISNDHTKERQSGNGRKTTAATASE
jgi:hypothetical protein